MFSAEGTRRCQERVTCPRRGTLLSGGDTQRCRNHTTRVRSPILIRLIDDVPIGYTRNQLGRIKVCADWRWYESSTAISYCEYRSECMISMFRSLRPEDVPLLGVSEPAENALALFRISTFLSIGMVVEPFACARSPITCSFCSSERICVA